MARRSSGSPAVGEYRWFAGLRQAAIAASTMCVGRREVGLAGAEADDGLAGGLERLGLGVDGERGGLGDGRDATGDTGITGHGPIVARAGRRDRTDSDPGTRPAARTRTAPGRRHAGDPDRLGPTSLGGHMTRIRRAGPRRSPLLGLGVGARRALLAVTVLATVVVRRSPAAGAAGPPAPSRRRPTSLVDARHRRDRRRRATSTTRTSPPSTIKLLTALVALEHLPLDQPDPGEPRSPRASRR